MNSYKIDWNKYSTDTHPYALYSKQGSFFTKWEFVASFKTKDEAREMHQKLIGLPIYLPS